MVDGSNEQRRADIRPVKEAMEDELLARPGVVGVDIGEKITSGEPTGEVGIIVYVKEKKKEGLLSEAELVPTTMEGVRTDVQELVIELQPVMQLMQENVRVDTTAYPSLRGGISMGPSRSVRLGPPEVPVTGEYTFVGTLGALVRDRVSGDAMALTNFHVACVNDGWQVGDRMVQPGIPDGGDPATGEFGSLARAQLTEGTDGAVISIDPASEWEPTVEEVGDVAGTSPAILGAAVQKRGRTTGLTFGVVGSTDATLSLDYGDGIGEHTLRRQIRIDTDTVRSDRFSQQGDSGSAVMDMDHHVIGLLFGGSTDGSTTFANPITVALDELDVELATHEPEESLPLDPSGCSS
ncbi:MAG: hypothetical protein Q4P15_05580 [Propionibacteriaceae bacterium]|nr:hypothetical protein [Propionibacteriaceae bacterium]